jgi:acetylornithine deacetylase/succinyl-diaminopimelate desuccinylase-like protein
MGNTGLKRNSMAAVGLRSSRLDGSPWGRVAGRPGAALIAIAAAAAAAALVSSPALAIWPFDRRDDEPLGVRAAKVLSRAIAIPSVNPPGDEALLASYLAEVADEAGLEARVIRTPQSDQQDEESSQSEEGDGSEGNESHRAAVWVRLEGDGTERPIVLLSHLDVVNAEPGEWSVPPFEGRIDAGRVFGRGALDAKGVTVMQLMALIELERRDAELTRDVILLATPDEESGGRLGAGHIVSEMPELLGGAEFLITEGGSIRTGNPESPSVWGVAVTEKSPCWLELTARGPPGHTSAPAPDAAVPRLVAALDSIRRIETPVRVLPEVQRMFRALEPAAAPEDRAGYRDLRRNLAEDRRFRRRFFANPARNAMVRNTVSITTLEGAPRTNVAPARARGHLDARLLPDESCEDFAHAVANVVADESVTVDTLLAFPSRISPIDTALYRAIERVAARDDPGAIVVPRMAAGFTDAHYFRDLGIVAYGFVPRWLSAEETRGIHGINESVTIENLERGTNTLTAILEELATRP